MKTANLLCITAFLALAGLMTNVGCSTPAVGEIDGNAAAASEGDDDDSEADDDDDTASKKPKKSTADKDTAPTNTASDDDDDTTTTTTPPPGDDDDDTTGDDDDTAGGGDECLSCLGGTGPAVKFIQCLDDNQCEDDTCGDKCFEQECAGNEEACDSKLQTCDAQCFDDGGGEEEQQ